MSDPSPRAARRDGGGRPGRLRRALVRTGAVVLAVGLAVLLGMLVPRPLWSAPDEPRDQRILVLTNPIHTDLALPLTEAVRDRFAFLGADVPIANPAAQWLVVGWGGRSFYLETPTWSDLKPLPVFRALTVDRAVLHVDAYSSITEPHPSVTGLAISEAGLLRLADYVAASFMAGARQPIPGVSYNGNDRFYEATGRFNVLVGCNTWAAGALREGGLRTGWWDPLPQTLAVSLKLLN